MGFRKASTWADRGGQLEAIKARCDEIIAKLGVCDNDARVQGMVHVRQFCNTTASVPIRLQALAERKDGLPLVNAVLGSRDIANTRSLLDDLNKNSKAAFLALVQFALENLVNRLLEGLGEKPVGSFKASVRKLMEKTSVLDIDAKLDLVCVPQYIRNTLHNNGVHTDQDGSFDVGGEKYVFEKGKEIRCGTWSHIFHALLHALGVYEEILLSSIVGAVPHVTAW